MKTALNKLSRYSTGFVIGMCLEYVYRVDTPYWYLPLSIAILMSVGVLADLLSKN